MPGSPLDIAGGAGSSYNLQNTETTSLPINNRNQISVTPQVNTGAMLLPFMDSAYNGGMGLNYTPVLGVRPAASNSGISVSATSSNTLLYVAAALVAGFFIWKAVKKS